MMRRLAHAFHGRFVIQSATILLVLLVAPVGHADSVADARVHYERGTAHYALGEFAQAAEEYQEAFRLKQDPALLYNAAQAYRLGGNREKALVLYRNYVLLFPNEPNVDVAQDQIAKLRNAIDEQTKTKAEERDATKPTPHPNLTSPTVAPPSRPAVVAVPHVARPPARRSKALILGLAIGGAAAAALAVGLGVGLTERQRDPIPTMGAWMLQ